jgi:histidyl-tRNA synthetase
MANLIEPRILKGFRDFLPAAEIERRSMTERIETSFRMYGFVPIDTPALEYAEILLGKGGGETEKQIYRFTDHGGRDVALRFDLTVPLARFTAEHLDELPLPFKRYQIAKVWRGENTQRGRYREFTQCDFDILGTMSPASDFEILLVMRSVLKAIGAGDITIKMNHRGLFNRFIVRLGLQDVAAEVLRVVDKRAKAGRDATEESLRKIAGRENAVEILHFIEVRGSFEETLEAVTAAAGGDCAESEWLRRIRSFMIDAGTDSSFVLDPSITRGLDYYTGLVFETFLNALPEIGSVCSGGRYDNLTGLYSRKRLSGVGSSIGLDRLISALESLGNAGCGNTYVKAAIACLNEANAGAYQILAERFRERGIPCEVFMEVDKLTRQFILAEKKGIRWLIVPGEKPAESLLTLREIKTRLDRKGLSVEDAAAVLSQ